jgi:hypothetical protein
MHVTISIIRKGVFLRDFILLGMSGKRYPCIDSERSCSTATASILSQIGACVRACVRACACAFVRTHVRVFSPPSVEALRAWLLLRDVDLSQWGAGPCKSVEDLYNEVVLAVLACLYQHFSLSIYISLYKYRYPKGGDARHACVPVPTFLSLSLYIYTIDTLN